MPQTSDSADEPAAPGRDPARDRHADRHREAHDRHARQAVRAGEKAAEAARRAGERAAERARRAGERAAERVRQAREREERRHRMHREFEARMRRDLAERMRKAQQRGRPWPPPGGPWTDPEGRLDHDGRRPPDWPPALGVFLAIVQVVGVRLVAGDERAAEFDALAYALLLAGPVALMFGRRLPLIPVVVSAAAAVVYALAGYPSGPFFVALIVSAVKAVRAGRVRGVLPVMFVAYVGYAVAGRGFPQLLGVPLEARPSFAALAIIALITLVTIGGSEGARNRSIQLAEMMRAQAEEQRAREEQDRRQASEERLSIARELHDVIGHHLSLINVQAGVGLHLMDSRPEQARSALAAIKTASSEALREVRAVLGALAAEDESAPREPAPGLDRLAALTERAGLPCRTVVTGTPRPVPAEVDRAAYRIVQEALTNVRRHAGGAATTVTISYEPAGLGVRIENEQPSAAGEQDERAPAGAGIGLPGMRARAQALGGHVEAEPTASGGYLVVAHLPTPAESREC